MEILLQAKEMLAIRGAREGFKLSCSAGQLWMTQCGDSRDHLPGPGELYESRLAGEVVITAFSESRFNLQLSGAQVERGANLALVQALGQSG